MSAALLPLLLVAGCDSGGSSTNGDRPDPPPDDSPVDAFDVTVQSDTLGLPGTLLVPDTSAAVPGVVLVHGSGAIDQNGQDPQGRIPPIFKRWAKRMADRGLAVLRYDKRTTQPEVAQADPRALTFLDLVRDAVAAARLLRNREAVDGDRIVLVGHSQGGNVAPAAATRLGNGARAASLAGPALAIDSLLVAQLRASPSTPSSVVQAARAQFDSLRAGTPPSDSLIEIGTSRAGVTFFRQWIRHTEHLDSVAAALDAPLLAQQGRTDRRYPGETLQRTLTGWRHIARADDATLQTYEDVDHNFLVEGTDSTAATPIENLIDWIRRR